MLINSKSQDSCCLVTKLHSGRASGQKAGKALLLGGPCLLICLKPAFPLLRVNSSQMSALLAASFTKPRHQLMHYLGEEATHPEPWPGQTTSWGHRLVFRSPEPWVILAREMYDHWVHGGHNLNLSKSWVSLDIFCWPIAGGHKMQVEKGQETCTKSHAERDRAVIGLQTRMTHCPLGLSVSLQSRRELPRQPRGPAKSWSAQACLLVLGNA